YEFPGTQYTADRTVRVTWYDGGLLPDAKLAPLPEGQSLPDNGSLFIGEKGVLLCRHVGMPQLLPKEKFADYPMPQIEEADHYLQWTNAIRGEGKTTSNFDYAGPLTETVLLGTVACHFASEQLAWDSTNLRFTKVSKANEKLVIEDRAEERALWNLCCLLEKNLVEPSIRATVICWLPQALACVIQSSNAGSKR
ncbi:MAG: hypothetical protein JF612_07480, partial [Planctomycetia bacterium]|nr:hypothetical protein [Planctomycetia bacterium]